MSLFILNKVAVPATPAAGKGIIFYDTADGKVKFKNDAGTVIILNDVTGALFNSLADAKGDLIAASAADTFTRLPVGTNGQVLIADSAEATGMKWGAITETDPAAIQKSLLDAKGDIIAASADNTPVRVPVGSNGQILSADSVEASGLKWIAAPSAGISPTIVDAKGDIITATANDTPVRKAAGADGQYLTALASESDGLKWIEGVRTCIKTSDQSVVDSNTLVDCTNLGFAVAAGGTYVFEFWVPFFSDDTACGIRLSMNGPASPNFFLATIDIPTSLTAFVKNQIRAYDVAVIGTAVDIADTHLMARITGVLNNGSNAGTLIVRFACETVTGTPTVTVPGGASGTIIRTI